ncbi:hypothetical protein [Qipengyuania pelagi]|uniref:hypothetical protein n=1 Tax=Qipengyuania pelagi TaxID=994320 RepID=UPI0031E8A72F
MAAEGQMNETTTDRSDPTIIRTMTTNSSLMKRSSRSSERPSRSFNGIGAPSNIDPIATPSRL